MTDTDDLIGAFRGSDSWPPLSAVVEHLSTALAMADCRRDELETSRTWPQSAHPIRERAVELEVLGELLERGQPILDDLRVLLNVQRRARGERPICYDGIPSVRLVAAGEGGDT